MITLSSWVNVLTQEFNMALLSCLVGLLRLYGGMEYFFFELKH